MHPTITLIFQDCPTSYESDVFNQELTSHGVPHICYHPSWLCLSHLKEVRTDEWKLKMKQFICWLFGSFPTAFFGWSLSSLSKHSQFRASSFLEFRWINRYIWTGSLRLSIDERFFGAVQIEIKYLASCWISVTWACEFKPTEKKKVDWMVQRKLRKTIMQYLQYTNALQQRKQTDPHFSCVRFYRFHPISCFVCTCQRFL